MNAEKMNKHLEQFHIWRLLRASLPKERATEANIILQKKKIEDMVKTESKEHPSFTKEQILQIVEDHLKKEK